MVPDIVTETVEPEETVRTDETVGTEETACPVEGCPVTFTTSNNERAMTRHVKSIVKKERAFYAGKTNGVKFWDSHNNFYVRKREQRGKKRVCRCFEAAAN
jgi:hypothetical protein